MAGAAPLCEAIADFMVESPEFASHLTGFYQAKRDLEIFIKS
jgi:hypothetical protein